MGAGAAQCFGLVVHHLHKGGDIPRHKIRHTAAAHISQDHRGFITALQVLGRVCMDQIVVDVTDIPDVKAGDAAIVFGGGAADSVDDVARMTGTINYEVLCDVGRRVQRVYVENGAEVELVDYLKGE